jgi:hypothetical protein
VKKAIMSTDEAASGMKPRLNLNLLGVIGALILAGCAHSVHEVYISDFGNYPAYAHGEMISASTEQSVIMGFVQDTDYVDVAKRSLIAQCPSGEITGISTQYSTSLGFFSWTNKILMQGLCVKSGRSARL